MQLGAPSNNNGGNEKNTIHQVKRKDNASTKTSNKFVENEFHAPLLEQRHRQSWSRCSSFVAADEPARSEWWGRPCVCVHSFPHSFEVGLGVPRVIRSFVWQLQGEIAARGQRLSPRVTWSRVSLAFGGHLLLDLLCGILRIVLHARVSFPANASACRGENLLLARRLAVHVPPLTKPSRHLRLRRSSR